MRNAHLGLALLLPVLTGLTSLGCGSSSTTDPSGGSGDVGSGDGSGNASTGSSGGSSGSGGKTDGGRTTTPADGTLIGVWKVSGTDARGAYTGEVELTSAATGLGFTRVIHYTASKVEDERDLWWVWQGTATGASAKLDVTVSLKRSDFVIRRGALSRSIADGPVSVTGAFKSIKAGELTGTFTGPDIAASETWTARKASGAEPIFATDRTVIAAHGAPSATTKATLFGAYANYQKLDVMKPYVARPEFQAAIHGHVIDKTDFGFYQQNPKALRVVGKVIDGISLAETMMRANAYRFSLKDKAAKYQADIDTKFMDPTVGMIVDGGPPQGPFLPSGDSALWTGTYVASQAYRYQVTGDIAARNNLVTSLEAILKLQEITGDWSQFARTLRKSTGAATGKWHAGTGAFAGLDWMEGGNNDMMKGLLYSYVVGYETLCSGASGFESMCSRIRSNAKHIADDIQTSQGFNQIPGAWLTAYVQNSLTYRAKVEGYWVAAKVEVKNNPVFYEQGTADWSGTHLTFIGDTISMLLASHVNIGGDAVKTYKDEIDESHKNLENQRLAVWHLIHAAYGSGAKTSPSVDDMKWRLREMPYPKLAFDVDRRISPEFCMSPYPALPWKNDFMDYPASDRTQALDSYPLFERPVDVSHWKTGLSYDGGGNEESPGVDFLHVYWYARKFGLLSATE